MGKRIIQRRRGKGSTVYRVKGSAFSIRFTYPYDETKGNVLKIIDSAGYTCPIAMIKTKKGTFFNVGVTGILEGQEIEIGENAQIKDGNIIPLRKIPAGTKICNIELEPYNGGKLIRSGGSYGVVTKKVGNQIAVMMPSKQEVLVNENSRATIGIVAGEGRTDKPFVKAGTKYFYLKVRNKHYPRTSPIKRNAVNHPFGDGRGKNMGKSSIAPRWAPPGRKVGLLRPRKTGRGR